MAAADEPQTYRNALRFRNSATAIRRFPFPFEADTYVTSANLRAHDRTGPTEAFHALFDVDEHYREEIREKAFVLSRDPLRCQVLPHMAVAEWDTLELVMASLARDFPAWFSLDRAGDRWRWHNRLLGTRQDFVFGDAATLPCGAFEFIGRQVQGDLLLLDQRDDTLWLDGGLLTAAQGWSLHFTLGMNWTEWHGPVTGPSEVAVIDRGLAFTLLLQAGAPVRRPNWIICVTPRLDNSLEVMADWARLYEHPPAAIGDAVFLRVEMQQLYRLPRSNAVLFAVRVYMASLADLTTVPAWTKRLHRVLRNLDAPTAAAKAVPFRDAIVEWLAPYDPPAEQSPAGI